MVIKCQTQRRGEADRRGCHLIQVYVTLLHYVLSLQTKLLPAKHTLISQRAAHFLDTFFILYLRLCSLMLHLEMKYKLDVDGVLRCWINCWRETLLSFRITDVVRGFPSVPHLLIILSDSSLCTTSVTSPRLTTENCWLEVTVKLSRCYVSPEILDQDQSQKQQWWNQTVMILTLKS